MKVSSLVDRISGEGAAAWDIHTEANRAHERGEDVIVLSVGDPDFATPAPIVEAAVSALRDGDTHYSAVAGRDELRAAIAADFTRQSGVATSADCVHVFAGTQNALFAASLCLLEKGDEVIALEPMYVSYQATLALGGAKLVPVAQPSANGFRPRSDLLKAAITPNTRAIVVTTPNNPTGVVLTEAELQPIADLAIEHDLWVIADEVYSDTIFDGEHKSIASLPGMQMRTVTISSLSKSHAMTGWRSGWAIAPPLLSPHFDNLGLCMLYGLPGFVQQASLLAMTDQRDASKAMRAIYLRRRNLICEALAPAKKLTVLKPQAGMYVMANITAYGMTGDEFCRKLYHSTGVSVLDGAAFGESANGWVRISFTVGDEQLKDGCARLVRFLNQQVS